MNDSAATASPRAVGGREALVEAAKRLLPDQPPSTIAGRDLAAEAGVNYGLVHHHFGGKGAALSAGLVALRADFMAAHGDAETIPLFTESDPYLRALVRSNVDYPESVHVGGDFPVTGRLVAVVADRLEQQGKTNALVEAKARAIALTSIQLCFSAFGPALLDATQVLHRERDDVVGALASLYETILVAEVD